MGEKEVALSADAKKDQRLLPVQSSLRPSPPPAASSLAFSLALQDAQAFGGTDSPSFVIWHQAHQPIWLLGETQSMSGLALSPTHSHTLR